MLSERSRAQDGGGSALRRFRPLQNTTARSAATQCVEEEVEGVECCPLPCCRTTGCCPEVATARKLLLLLSLALLLPVSPRCCCKRDASSGLLNSP